METDNSTQVIVEKDERLWCTICESFIVGATNQKNVKQHLKSITHKKSLKGASKKQCIPEDQLSCVEKELDFECAICTWTNQDCIHPLDPTNATYFVTTGLVTSPFTLTFIS